MRPRLSPASLRMLPLSAAILPGLLFAATLPAQTPAPVQDSADVPVMKVDARAVVVDVVVNSKDGKPVLGLQKDKFLVTEDSRTQNIVSFEEHTGAPSPASNIKLPELPPHVFTNVPRVPLTDSVTVLLIDSLNTPIQEQIYVHDQIMKYLKNPLPGRRMAIFALGGRLRFIQGFTADPAVLAGVLNNMKRGAAPEISDLLKTKPETDLEQTAVDQFATVGGQDAGDTARSAAQSLMQFQAEQTASQTSLRVTITLEAFQQLGQYLAGIPGRKNVVWFSSSFPLGVFPDYTGAGPTDTDHATQTGSATTSSSGAITLRDPMATQYDFAEKVRKTDALLAAAQVAIYPIGAEGVDNNSIYDGDKQNVAVYNAQQSQERETNLLQSDSTRRGADHLSMDQIAKDTGGEAIYNSNGLSEALAKVADYGSHFYTLSYTPTNPLNDGLYRKIQVKLASGNYRISYRRGYYAVNEKTEMAVGEKVSADPLLAFMRPGTPASSQIPMALHVEHEIPGAIPATSANPANSIKIAKVAKPDDKDDDDDDDDDAPATATGASPNPAPAPAPIPVAAAATASTAGDNPKAQGPFTRYSVDFVIAEPALQLTTSPDGGHHGKLAVAVVAYDERGHALNWLERGVQVDLDAAHFAEALKTGVKFRMELDVPKEGVSLRSAVYDNASKQAGSLEIPLNRVAETNPGMAAK